MKRLLPVLLLIAVACGSGGGTASSSPSPSASAAPSLSPTPAALACRLPIAAGDAPLSGPSGGGVTGHGGFVTMPSGAFVVDPPSSGAYDHLQSRWLPTSYHAVSPDGARYAYAEPAIANPDGPPHVGIVHVINVATGTDHPVSIPGPVAVIGWTATAIYVESIVPQSDAPPVGLTVVNPDTQTFRQITSLHQWLAVGDHAAFTTDIDPADPSPPVQNGPGPIPGDRIQKLDLTTESLNPFLTIDGARVSVLGIDSSGNPIVGANSAGGFTVRLTPSNLQIFSGPSMDTTAGNSDPLSALADSTGIWFSSIAGVIYHWATGDLAVHQVAATGLSYPGLAGPCT